MITKGAACLAIACFCSVACNENIVFIDPFPIQVDTSTGPVVLGASFREADPPLAAVLDTMSPITVFEPDAVGDASQYKLRSITLFARSGTGAFGVPRARFPFSAAFSASLCPAGPGGCAVGAPGLMTPIQGVIGGDVIGRAAVRFDFAGQNVRIFPDMAGSDLEHSRQCEAVFPRPFTGGGTLHVGDNDVRFIGVRPWVSACLDVSGAPTTGERGLDALFLISTGVGPTILSASAYDRYAELFAAPARETLPAADVLLSGGTVPARRGQIGQYALVGEGSNQRGPCRELYANRVMSENLCARSPGTVPICPCEDNDLFCRTGAAVVAPRPLDVFVIADDTPLLQALREELRPALPDLDGILGTEALSMLQLDLDYPHNRLILRCTDPTICLARPMVRDTSELGRIADCLSKSTLH